MITLTFNKLLYCILGVWSDWGERRKGSVDGEIPTHTPNTISPTASGLVNKCIQANIFSANMINPITDIQNKSMLPSANKINIKPQQQPTQTTPCSIPSLKATSIPAFHLRKKKEMGEVQWIRQDCFIDESWYSPEATITPPASTDLWLSDNSSPNSTLSD
jgi:hypothetical protein